MSWFFIWTVAFGWKDGKNIRNQSNHCPMPIFDLFLDVSFCVNFVFWWHQSPFSSGGIFESQLEQDTQKTLSNGHLWCVLGCFRLGVVFWWQQSSSRSVLEESESQPEPDPKNRCPMVIFDLFWMFPVWTLCFDGRSQSWRNLWVRNQNQTQKAVVQWLSLICFGCFRLGVVFWWQQSSPGGIWVRTRTMQTPSRCQRVAAIWTVMT